MTEFLVFVGSDLILAMLIGWCLGCLVILIGYGLIRLFGWLLMELIEFVDLWERRKERP